MRSAAWYSRFAKAAAHFCGRPRVFALAVAIIAMWIITGPMFGFSDTWQLVISDVLCARVPSDKSTTDSGKCELIVGGEDHGVGCGASSHQAWLIA